MPAVRGSFLGRLTFAYVGEGLRLLDEGVELFRIENAGKGLSLLAGPIATANRVGGPTLLAVMAAREDDSPASGDLLAAGPLLQRLLQAGKGQVPVLTDADEAGRLDAEAIRAAFPVAKAQPDQDTLKTRLMAAMVLEALRAMEDGQISTPETGDVAAVFGLGFAAWTGGPFTHIDTMGAEAFVALSARLSEAHGARFRIPDAQRAALASGKLYYPTLDFAA